MNWFTVQQVHGSRFTVQGSRFTVMKKLTDYAACAG